MQILSCLITIAILQCPQLFTMKQLTDAISRLKETGKTSLAGIVRSPNESINTLTGKVNTMFGLHRLLSRCSPGELSIIEEIYNASTPLTIGDLEKKLSLPPDRIEEMAHSCSELVLVYIIKNRQLLTNKMDKVYPIQEIGRIIKPAGPAELKNHALSVAEALMKGTRNDQKVKSPAPGKQALISKLMEYGGFALLDELLPDPSPAEEENLETLVRLEYVSIYHVLSPSLSTIICIRPEHVPALSREIPGSEGNIHNGYIMAHNLLRTYDTVSTNGLFYTKQERFRRIDLKRISDALVPLKTSKGETLDNETAADLYLHMLFRLGCISLKRDIAEISMKSIRREIRNPAVFTNRIISALESAKPGGEAFPSPVDLPSTRCLKGIIKIMTSLEKAHVDYIRTVLAAYFLSDKNRKITDFSHETIDEEWNRTLDALNFLCMAGLLDVNKGYYTLSDAGRETAEVLFRISSKKALPAQPRAVYINPDYTLIIPAGELSSSLLYILLSYVEITQEDVMLHGSVTRSSIIRAEKRGMHVKVFLETLELCSRNEIPQNLHYVLNEWARQTMKVTVTTPVLLHCTHPGFLDEILYGGLKDAVIERIAPNYALINQEHLEEIVRLARKKDAVLSLFEE